MNGGTHRRESTLHFQVGVVSTTISSAVRPVLDDYAALYAPFRTPRPAEGGIHVRVERARKGWFHRRRHIVTVNARRQFEPARAAEVVPYLDWAINWEVPRAYPQALHLHAASMSLGGQGLILPALSGSGKSTLASGLLARGWGYLSDEFAIVDTATLAVQPYPRCICIKKPSMPAVEVLGLPVFRRRYYLKGAKGYVGYIRATDVRADAVSSACPVRFIVFPKYVRGAEPALVPVSRAEAALALHEVCFNLLTCPTPALSMLTELVRGAQCYRLIAGDLERTCVLLERLFTCGGCQQSASA